MPAYSPAACRLHSTLTNSDLGSTIRTERQLRGLHQDVLAAASGIDPKVFSRVERGERPLRVLELAAIAAALELGAEELLARAQMQSQLPQAS